MIAVRCVVVCVGKLPDLSRYLTVLFVVIVTHCK